MHIGVLDVRNNKAFLVDGPQVPQSLVRQHDLRRGDQISGEAENDKLISVDTVNGVVYLGATWAARIPEARALAGRALHRLRR